MRQCSRWTGHLKRALCASSCATTRQSSGWHSGISSDPNGYEVDEAGDGKSALQCLKNRQIDLLLLDFEMPDVDGFDVLNYIAKHLRSLPVIHLSGMRPDEIQGKMLQLHDRELPPLLLKPVDPEQLVEMVEMHLSGELP